MKKPESKNFVTLSLSWAQVTFKNSFVSQLAISGKSIEIKSIFIQVVLKIFLLSRNLLIKTAKSCAVLQ
jgi:hypothetical protein